MWRWFVPPVLALIGFLATWLMEKRRVKTPNPWISLLATDARSGAAEGRVGALSGVASDNQQSIGAIVAPFTGRACLAFHIEVVARERQPGPHAETITWRRVFEDAKGQVAIADERGAVVASVQMQGARPLLPPDLADGPIRGVTVFASSSSMVGGGDLPPHLAAFVANLGLPQATKDSLFTAGRNLTFNERVVLPGQALVVAGTCTNHEGHGVSMIGSDVFFSDGDLRAARARAQIAGKMESSAFVVAVLVGLVAAAIVAITS